MSDALEIFEAHAGAYAPLRRRLVPCFDAFYGAAVAAAGLGGPPRRVLDLGAGTGLLSAHVAAEYPGAELVLLDGSPAMLDEARAALGEGVELRAGDLRDPFPEGPFDAVVSALAIHHLDDDGKRSVYARALDVLAPGGVFVNAEQTLGPTPELHAVYRDWHHAASTALGSDDEEWAGAVERMSVDLYATLEDQLAWLRDAGFVSVDCLFKQFSFAVFCGRRPSS